MHQYVPECKLSDQSKKWVQLMFQDGNMEQLLFIWHSQLSMDKIHFIPTFSLLHAKMSNFKNKILCICCAAWDMCIQVHKTNSSLLQWRSQLHNIPRLFCLSIRRSLYSHIFTAVLRSVFQLLIFPSVWLFSLDFKSDQSPIITLSA